MHHEPIQPAITFLNLTGDVTITWDADNEAAMLALIEQKMKEGFSFFVLKPRVLSILGKKKVRAEGIQDVAQAGSAVVPDCEFQRMMAKLELHDPAIEAVVSAGQASLTRPTLTLASNSIKRAQSAADVLCNQTVAVRPVVGG